MLGLIYANKGGSGGGNNEIVQHGSCLGIGLAAVATGNEDLFEFLRAVLFTDSAVTGEGASSAIGLLMLGQSDAPLCQQVLPDLLVLVRHCEREDHPRQG